MFVCLSPAMFVVVAVTNTFVVSQLPACTYHRLDSTQQAGHLIDKEAHAHPLVGWLAHDCRRRELKRREDVAV